MNRLLSAADLRSSGRSIIRPQPDEEATAMAIPRAGDGLALTLLIDREMLSLAHGGCRSWRLTTPPTPRRRDHSHTRIG
ncbi:MAG: hypothetical protein ACRDP6_42455 [Actinoallomurus sp.]